MKKLLSVLLALALLLPAAAFASGGGGGRMYVDTPNGKSLNVRYDMSTGDNIVGHLKYGAAVDVVQFYPGDWAEIVWGDTTCYVQARFLQWDKPGPKPTPTEDPNQGEKNKQKRELDSEEDISPITIKVYSTRASGWAPLRKEPSKLGKVIERCTDGQELQAFAETKNWYHVTDQDSGKEGYIYKDHVCIVQNPAPEPAPEPASSTANIGRLNVNGAFTLQCTIPEGYNLQVISAQSTRIIATLTSDDATKPQMMLTVAFDDMFSGVERMNDMSSEDIDALKKTFTDMNDVEFTEAETGKGTKLLVAREVGEDEDFVSIITVYKGYSIEFVLTPNPASANQTISDEQVQKCIEFLTDLDFVPAA